VPENQTAEGGSGECLRTFEVEAPLTTVLIAGNFQASTSWVDCIRSIGGVGKDGEEEVERVGDGCRSLRKFDGFYVSDCPPITFVESEWIN